MCAIKNAYSIFYQNKINEFFQSPRLFKLTSYIIGTSKKIQYTNIPAYIRYTHQINGTTFRYFFNTLRFIAFSMAVISPLLSNYDINF